MSQNCNLGAVGYRANKGDLLVTAKHAMLVLFPPRAGFFLHQAGEIKAATRRWAPFIKQEGGPEITLLSLPIAASVNCDTLAAAPHRLPLPAWQSPWR